MLIGLTGGIGCGKSTVLKLFEKQGFRTLNADSVVRVLLNEDPLVKEAIIDRWSGVLDQNGSLRREQIAKIVFDDKEELSWLEDLLHPRVQETWTAAVCAEPNRDWCVEIPLLFEKNLEKHFQFTVCIDLDLQSQLQRLSARGLSEDQAVARMSQQLPIKEKILRADFVLSNTGDISFLEQQVYELADRLKRLN